MKTAALLLFCACTAFATTQEGDGHQEGVEVGYTRVGTKPCLHPLLAIFSEVRLVTGFWLRPGNCSCANNVVGFFLDLWDNLPARRAAAGSLARLQRPGPLRERHQGVGCWIRPA